LVKLEKGIGEDDEEEVLKTMGFSLTFTRKKREPSQKGKRRERESERVFFNNNNNNNNNIAFFFSIFWIFLEVVILICKVASPLHFTCLFLNDHLDNLLFIWCHF
jgi:hypothetical protein